MPLTPDEYHAHAIAAADEQGRLPRSPMTEWDIFPYEADGLTVVPLRAPELPEPARAGAGGVDCHACEEPRGTVWRDEHWRLSVSSSTSGAPLRMSVGLVEHADLPDLSDERAAELGVLLVHVTRAVEGLPHVARAHVSRWGDGAEHLHLFVYARLEGMRQMLGTLMPLWDDTLPPVPREQRDADAQAVARTLAATYGGEVVARA